MGVGNELESLSERQNLLLGLAAGVSTKVINYPLLNIKNHVQQSLPIPTSPAVLYRGLPMACANLGGTTAVQFGATGTFQRYFLQGATTKDQQSRARLAGAFAGGVLSAIPCSVWELTMIQQQRFGGSLFATPPALVQKYGAGILRRGMSMTIGRESIYNMSMLGITPEIQSRVVAWAGEGSTNIALGAGALLGATFACVVTHPCDVLKTCLQGDCAREKYTNLADSARLIINRDGLLKGMYRGLTWRIGLISTTFFLVNFFKTLYVPIMFSKPSA